ncbi:MAG: GGDEF domain-containing protein [Acidimicrobiales bacterium]|nr:GGDEF domain-containing protein [Acidimicrobiales bacterium]
MNTSQFLLGAIVAIIGFSAVMPAIFVMFVVKPDHLRVGYFDAMVVATLTVVTFSVVQLYQLRKGSGMFITPPMLFILASIATFATGFMEAADGGPHLIFVPILFLNVLYFFVVGNAWMRIGGGIVTCLVYSWCVYESGLRGSSYLAALIVGITVISLAQLMIFPIWANQNRNIKLLSLQRRIVEIAGETPTTEQSLEITLPLLSRLLPIRRAVAVAVDNDGDLQSVLAAWPVKDPGDLALGGTKEAIRARLEGVPIIADSKCWFLGGFAGSATVIIVLEFGKVSWLAKFSLEDTIKAIHPSFLGLTARRAHIELLEFLSQTDPLTGIPNRRVIFDNLNGEIERARRSEKPLSVAMLDLDHFKIFNDTFGHVAGDKALSAIVDVWQARVRAQDTLGRYGGEEFTLIMPETDTQGAVLVLDELRKLTDKLNLEAKITASAGVATWNKLEDVPTFLDRADQALYNAKRRGRNRVEYL